MPAQWYLLSVRPQRERSTKTAIENLARAQALEEHIHDVVVPTHSQTLYQEGKRVIRERISFPGYVMVRMEMSDALQNVLRRIPTVMSFISDQDQDTDRWLPCPMSDTEVAQFLNGEQRHEHGIMPGDAVRIIDGPFTNAIAQVESSDAGNDRIRVSINIFGRPTPLELTVAQIAKTD